MATRVLLIGHSSIPIGVAAEWDQAELPNVLDHEFVIVDLSTFPDTPSQLWHQQVKLLRNRLARFVGIGKRLVVFMPTKFGTLRIPVNKQGGANEIRRLDLVPCNVHVTLEPGEVIKCQDKEWKWFVDKLKDWTFHFTVSAIDDNVQSNNRPLATNLEGKWLAASMDCSKGGGITLLPSRANISNLDVIVEMLVKLFPDDFTSTEPDWAGEIDVPGMSALEKGIATLQQESERLAAERVTLESDLAHLREWRRLVYGSGPALERIVARAFSTLGATVLDARYGDEEFVLQSGGIECLVEVKGVGNSASKAHVLQLMGYLVTAGDDHDCKGILVVNAWRDTPLHERESPNTRSFPDNVVKFAAANNIALLSGIELLVAVHKTLLGELDGAKAIDRILNTAGIVKFP